MEYTKEQIEALPDEFDQHMKKVLERLHIDLNKHRLRFGKCSQCKEKNVVVVGGYHKNFYCPQCLYDGIFLLERIETNPPVKQLVHPTLRYPSKKSSWRMDPNTELSKEKLIKMINDLREIMDRMDDSHSATIKELQKYDPCWRCEERTLDGDDKSCFDFCNKERKHRP